MILTYTLPQFSDWEDDDFCYGVGSVAWMGDHLAHTRPIMWWEVDVLRTGGAAWGQRVTRERIEEPALDDGLNIWGEQSRGYCVRLANGGRRV